MAAKKKAEKKQAALLPALEEHPAELAAAVSNPLLRYLVTACHVCERGAAVGLLRQVIFRGGRMQAYNGIYQYQAPTELPKEEEFGVSNDKLARALTSCGGEGVEINSVGDFLKFKNGPFSVKVRKQELTSALERISISKEAEQQRPFGMLETLRLIREFISTDASRPWSTSVLLHQGYAWATNNLSLVRCKFDHGQRLEGARIPGAYIDFLCSMETLDHYDIDESGRVIFMSGRTLSRSPQSQAEWPLPMLDDLFSKMPETMSPVPREMRDAVERVEKFADRFVSIDAAKIEGKTEAIETQYEVEGTKGIGLYSAKLIKLVVAHATHINFDQYPKIYFCSDKIEGVAMGQPLPSSPEKETT